MESLVDRPCSNDNVTECNFARLLMAGNDCEGRRVRCMCVVGARFYARLIYLRSPSSSPA